MAPAGILQLRIERPSCRRQTNDRRIASILDAHAAQGSVAPPGEGERQDSTGVLCHHTVGRFDDTGR